MLPFGVPIPATVPQGSEIPEVLMNNLVFQERKIFSQKLCGEIATSWKNSSIIVKHYLKGRK
jgi:hypothetical protein